MIQVILTIEEKPDGDIEILSECETPVNEQSPGEVTVNAALYMFIEGIDQSREYKRAQKLMRLSKLVLEAANLPD
jgi:hypothetical protein